MRKWTRWLIAGALAIGLAHTAPGPTWANGTKIMLDAGHGGPDPGAIGVNKLYEKTVALDVTLKLRDELEKRGYQVVLTRDRDVGLTLAQRVEAAARQKPDLFISIHANAHTSSTASGSLVLYYDSLFPQAAYPASASMIALSPESKKLAAAVQAAMVKEAGTQNRGIVPSAAYVVRMGAVPSILVETAFLSNPQDAALLANDRFRQKLAVGIANGIEAYRPSSIRQPDEASAADPPAEPGTEQEELPSMSRFGDLASSHWAAAAIYKLHDKGIVKGDKGLFYPDRGLTRAEFITMLERLFPIPDLRGCGQNGGSTSAPEGSLTSCQDQSQTLLPSDLAPSHWAYSTFLLALDRGLIHGYSDGTVRPEGLVNRAEAAVLIDRVIYPGSSQQTSHVLFEDVPVTLWSAAAINRLKTKGIVEGAGSGLYAPDRSMTRAEMSTLLSRLIH